MLAVLLKPMAQFTLLPYTLLQDSKTDAMGRMDLSLLFGLALLAATPMINAATVCAAGGRCITDPGP